MVVCLGLDVERFWLIQGDNACGEGSGWYGSPLAVGLSEWLRCQGAKSIKTLNEMFL